MEKIFCPSLMCAEFDNLKSEIDLLNEADVDIFHCDIMDGNFVSNMAMGINDVKTVKKSTRKLIDCHLMIDNPGNKLDWFIDAGADLVYIHPESERYVAKALMHIKEREKLAGLAINPDISLESISEILPLADYILIMTVNPGFAGQKFLEFTDNKIKKAIKLKDQLNFKIVIDGSCSPEVIEKYSNLGVDGFVLGTSALFGKEKSYKDIIKELQKL